MRRLTSPWAYLTCQRQCPEQAKWRANMTTLLTGNIPPPCLSGVSGGAGAWEFHPNSARIFFPQGSMEGEQGTWTSMST